LAISPTAVEGEALAAFNRARELVRRNPDLAHPQSEPVKPPPSPDPHGIYTARITTVHPDWLLILVGLLSDKAYELKLLQKISFDFNELPTAVSIICDGPNSSRLAFERHIDWVVAYINEKLREPN
jgi:hypothetical protein